jgi:hypothetical protein
MVDNFSERVDFIWSVADHLLDLIAEVREHNPDLIEQLRDEYEAEYGEPPAP